MQNRFEWSNHARREREMYDMCMLIQFIIHRDSRKYLFGNEISCRRMIEKKKITLFPFKSLYLCHRLNCVTSKMLSRGNKKNQMPNRTIIISSHFALFNIDVLKHNDVVKTVIWFCYVEMSFLSIKALSYSLINKM